MAIMMANYKTYKVMNSKTGDILTRSFEGCGLNDFDTRVGLPEDRALRVINEWNRRQALTSNPIQWTYWIE